ncbi:putative disease resistance protein At3g14460 [Pistacia vera]|uniref:putative disease resistance protein At3g14460 n=1 Tax=Pistacia vera TaxID=55513 RepID=UPI001263433B|nr:putative disease resistance protein At3g14460 [Pistacia vera]
MEDTHESDNQYVFSNNILRHLSYISGPLDGIEKLEASNNIKGLRTFLLLMMQGKESFYLPREQKAFIHPKLAFHVKKNHDSSCIEEAVIHPKLWKLHCLRVLSLHIFCIRELPNQIGDLKHLRYLDLSYTCIESLPESVSTLYNLQALVLEGCARLRKLCADIGNLINLHHVNIFKVDSLEQMPLRISKLTGLQTLSKFVVGKGVGSGIAELKSLTHLRERLHISRLENVHDANDVEEADLNGEENLNELVLEWKCSGVISKPGETQMQVLGMLRPHQNMKKLIIRGYDGIKFPTWLGDFSFSKLECLKFQYCRKCISLPSVGQLRSLKDLVFKGMNGVKCVGLDFYGNGFSAPFPSLEILHFLDMKEWEEWVPHRPSEEVECFPQLRELRIIRCPNLRGRLPKCLHLLNKLVIEKCKKFSVSVPSFPALRELKIGGCKVVEWSTVDLRSLKSVVLSRVSNRVSLAEGFMQGMPNLEELTISGCRQLTSFCETEMGLHQDISSLHPPLFSLMTEEEEEQGQKGLPCRLQYLELGNCECLDKLPQALHNLSSLRELYLRNCTNLFSFAGIGVPSQLKSFRIENCKALESFPEALISSSNISLETIVIEKCLNLKSLPDDMNRLTSLQKVILQNCSSIVRFPEGGLPSTKLTELRINGCEKLMALPNNMHNLSCLQELRIERCPGIVSFPQDGFPTNLAFLMMKDVNICKPLFDWGLHKLNSLRILYIRGGCDDVESFPQEEMEMTLPTSLTTIQI